MMPLLTVSPACVIVEAEATADAGSAADSNDDTGSALGSGIVSTQRGAAQLKRRTIVVYERKSGVKLWEGKREPGVVLREADDSWYVLRREGLFSLIVGQTQERLLHNMIMGGARLT
jgi:hypothetical protein